MNKGIGKIFFSKNIRFIFNRKVAVTAFAEFTLSQCRIGWCKLERNLQIHLLFVDIIFEWITFKNREQAAKCIRDQKEQEERIKKVFKPELWK